MRSFIYLTFFVELFAEELTIDSAIQGFVNFKNAFSRKYTSTAEEAQRFNCFVENSKIIQTLNSQDGDATYAINKFGDICANEFKATRLNLNLKDTNLTKISKAVEVETPKEVFEDESFDWRLRGGVVPVKDQGNCGSCWAFSSVCTMEGSWFAAGNKLTAFSEEQLVDCNPYYFGCDGGNPAMAIYHIIQSGGIDTAADYPYIAGVKGWATPCNWTKVDFRKVGVFDDIIPIRKKENKYPAYLQKYGPLAIAVDATSWTFYEQGIYTKCDGKDTNHGVNIVGYGVATKAKGSMKYWVVRNSWGQEWGEAGYIRIKRGVNCDNLKTNVLAVTV